MSIDPFEQALLQDLNDNNKFHLREFVYKYATYWKWFILSAWPVPLFWLYYI